VAVRSSGQCYRADPVRDMVDVHVEFGAKSDVSYRE
jgi:hypothetical protein